MPSDADFIADRRRLRRKLTFWRVLGVLAAVAAVAALGWRMGGFDGVAPGAIAAARDHVARVEVSGVITTDRRFVEMLDRIAESPTARGVVVNINSPGGTTTGSEELYAALRRLAERKPTVAFVEGTAASGAYIAALGTERIVARQTSIVGSVGVIMQVPNVVDLLDNLGVTVTEVKSAPLKAAPSPVTPSDPAAFQALQVVVDDTFRWFQELVAERRGFDPAQLARISDGRVFNGRQGLALGLVDALGTERDAIAWLETERGVAADLPVRGWEPERDRSPFRLAAAASGAAQILGFETLAGLIARAEGLTRAYELDGLLALWQPHAEIPANSSR